MTRLLIPAFLALSLAGCATTMRKTEPHVPPVAPVRPIAEPELAAAVRHFEAGELDAAEKLLAAYREAHPESAEAAFYLGRVHYQRQRYPRAIDQLEAAVALDDGDVDYYLWLGKALADQVHRAFFFQKLPMAKRIHAVYERAVELAPERIEGHIALARFYSEAPAFAGGDRDKSLHHAREVIRLDPVEGHLLLAAIYELFGELEPAIREYEAALALDADRGDARESLAKLRQRQAIADGQRSP